MRRAALLAVVPFVLAADPAPDRVAKLRARHDAAMQSVTDAYWRQRLVADQAYLSGLQAQVRSTPEDKTLQDERDRAQAEVAADVADQKSHTPLTTLGAAKADLMAAERKANMTPAAAKAIAEHQLLAGMTLDQANQAMGIEGTVAGGDADSQTIQWTLSHPLPLRGGAVIRGEDSGEAGVRLLEARARANEPRPRVIDAVWSGRFEGGRLVRFQQVQ